MAKDYNKLSSIQHGLNLRYLQTLLKYALLASKLPISSLNIADLGCSTGRNSFILFKEFLLKFREESSLPIVITHEDQPMNFWDVFYKTFSDCGYADIPNVYSYVTGKSFYEPLFPENSLHIAYCNNALHYVKEILPCPDHTVAFLSESPEIREQAIQIGKDSLKLVLELRAKELVKGGYFVLDAILKSPEINAFFNHDRDFIVSLVNEGFFKQEEFERMIFPVYTHSEEDWNEVLASLSHLYTVHEFSTRNEPNPLFKTYQETQDIKTYSTVISAFVRGVFEATIRNGLIRDESEKEKIVDEFFKRYEEYNLETPPEMYDTRITVILEVIKSD